MDNINLDKRQSLVIDAMRFPLITLVVFIHILPAAKMILWSRECFDFYIFISEVISHNIARVAVPCFFFISGYLFFIKKNEFTFAAYLYELKKRSRTILLPYLIWIIIFIVVIIITNLGMQRLGFKTDRYFSDIKQETVTSLFWGSKQYIYPINYPLWYLRDLITLTIFTPLFYYILKYTYFALPLLFIVLFITGVEIDIPGLSIVSLAFFTSGAYFAISKKNILKEFMKIRWGAYLLSFIFLCLSIYYNGKSNQTIFLNLYIFFGIIALFVFMDKAHKTKFFSKNIKLSKYVFFIYISHAIVLYVLNIFVVKFKSTFELSNLFLIIICFGTAITTVCFCIFIYKILNKYFPTICKIATGGRINKIKYE